jgi:hypothetical protein
LGSVLKLIARQGSRRLAMIRTVSEFEVPPSRAEDDLTVDAWLDLPQRSEPLPLVPDPAAETPSLWERIKLAFASK